MLENWFEQNSDQLNSYTNRLNDTHFGKKISTLSTLEKGLDANDMAILTDDILLIDTIACHLYPLHYPWKDVHVINLGAVRNRSKDFLKTIFTELIQANVKLICLCKENDIYEAYLESMHLLRSSGELVQLTSSFDKHELADLQQTFSITNIGIQGHLGPIVNTETVTNFRLGEVKTDVFLVEPFCRKPDVAIWNIDCMNYQSFPGHEELGPAGMNAEEITQISRYLGFNDHLQALFIKGYQPAVDVDNQGAKLIAQCIWYYIDAVDLCTKENLHHAEDYTEYVVDIDQLDDPIIFIKGKKTGRWWFKDEQTNQLKPCSAKDYQIACQNDIPVRFLM